jgi:hypothetical protein
LLDKVTVEIDSKSEDTEKLPHPNDFTLPIESNIGLIG